MSSVALDDKGQNAVERRVQLLERGRRRASLALATPERRAIIAFGDALAGAAGCAVAYLTWEIGLGRALDVPKRGPALFALAWVIALFLVDGYDVQVPASRVRSLLVVFKAVPIVSFFGFLAFFAEPYRMARPVIVLSVIVGALCLATSRLTVARLLLHERFAKRAILVQTGQLTPVLAEALEGARYEYRVVGSVGLGAGQVGGVPDLGTDADLPAIAQRCGADEVIIGSGGNLPDGHTAEVCFNHGIRVVRAIDLFERYQCRVPLAWVDDTWFLSLPTQDLFKRPYLVFRRITDIVLALLLILPFLAVLPILSLLIKLDHEGPVFFRQRRVGQYGREIDILKLRTMRADAELAGHRWAERADPRVTRVGRILRRTRLDELPQVINVLRGDMSFIGPRPERPEFVAELRRAFPHYSARLTVKPGISGWAQVKAGYAASVQESIRKLEYDLFYIKRQSLLLDLQIVLHSAFTVLGFRGR